MPLSDKEEEILRQIERQLYDEDPKFAKGVATTLDSHAARRLKIGIAVFVLGFMTLIGFLATRIIAVGVGAFLMMLLGALFAYQNVRRAASKSPRGNAIRKAFEDRIKDIRNRSED